jgi:3-hydroxybutyryl-CoA dehydrogenase
MAIAVLADDVLKQEWLTRGMAPGVEIMWVDSVRSLAMIEADAYVDLLFEMNVERTAPLKRLLPKPVFVNAVAYTTADVGGGFIRINGWPTMLQRPVTEIALPAGVQEDVVEKIFTGLQWRYQVVPDIPGMITPRILAMIINEAYFTLGAGVSTRGEIDIAMKLGTNYPMGPFEWSKKIGLQRVYELLQQLSIADSRYMPAEAMEQEMKNGK